MKNVIIILISVFFVGSVSAQKIKLTEGSLGFIDDVKELKVEYDYSDMSVGKYDSEADYVADKTKAYNEKEANRGDGWAESWVNDREARFQPGFEELFNKHMEELGVKTSTDATSDYRMVVKTVSTEPGFNIGIMKKPALLNMEITFFNGDKEEAVMTVEKAPGKTFGSGDFDTGVRITEAYSKAAKEIAKYIVKKK